MNIIHLVYCINTTNLNYIYNRKGKRSKNILHWKVFFKYFNLKQLKNDIISMTLFIIYALIGSPGAFITFNNIRNLYRKLSYWAFLPSKHLYTYKYSVNNTCSIFALYN